MNINHHALLFSQAPTRRRCSGAIEQQIRSLISAPAELEVSQKGKEATCEWENRSLLESCSNKDRSDFVRVYPNIRIGLALYIHVCI